jgi:hypothetical protein
LVNCVFSQKAVLGCFVFRKIGRKPQEREKNENERTSQKWLLIDRTASIFALLTHQNDQQICAGLNSLSLSLLPSNLTLLLPLSHFLYVFYLSLSLV